MATAKKTTTKKTESKGFGEKVLFKPGERFSPFDKVAVKFSQDFKGFRKDSVYVMHPLQAAKYLNKEGVPAKKVEIPKAKSIQDINESDIPKGGQVQ